MPLIIICGIPSSGKTTRAVQIKSFLEEQGQKVVLVNEESLNLERNACYKDSKVEKMTRGTLLAESERYITTDVTVILDSLNYIKGFRYEVFCRARTQRTANCVIHCDVPRDISREWNSKKEHNWNSQLFEELCDRFEVPNSRNRWDRPLFTLTDKDETPLKEIHTVLFESEDYIPTKNMATEYNKIEEPNFLYEMDQTTQAIINYMLEASNNGILGEITVPKASQKVHLKRKVTLAELRRLRRQFTKIGSLKPQPVDTIGDSFVSYLNTNLES